MLSKEWRFFFSHYTAVIHTRSLPLHLYPDQLSCTVDLWSQLRIYTHLIYHYDTYIHVVQAQVHMAQMANSLCIALIASSTGTYVKQYRPTS